MAPLKDYALRVPHHVRFEELCALARFEANELLTQFEGGRPLSAYSARTTLELASQRIMRLQFSFEDLMRKQEEARKIEEEEANEANEVPF